LLYLTFREKQLGEALTSYKQVQSIVNFQAINGERSDLEAGLVSLSLIPLEQQLADLQREKVQTYQELQNLMFSTDTIILSESGYPFLLFQTATNNADSALLVRMEYQQTAKLDAEKALMKAQRLPLISVGYFNQTLIGTQNINGQDVSFTASDRFQGVQAGVSIPIFTRAENGRISQQELALKQAINTAEQRKLELLNRLSAIRSEWQILYDQQQLWVNNTLPTGLKVQDQLQFALEKGELTVDRILIQKEQWIQMQLLQLERIRLANVLLLEFNYLNQ
jgi:cobalt-zinc-cadmium resistance protein CzcA